MLRYLLQPLNAGVLHGDVWVEAPGDGAGDEGGALLLEQLDQLLLPRHQGVDLCRFAVEEGGDCALILCRRYNNPSLLDVLGMNVLLPPMREQRTIVDDVDKYIAGIDSAVARIATGIERLTEFRTALISAAVTGKIDVRKEAS